MTTRRYRQVMDWRAAFVAGVIAGLIFLIAMMIVNALTSGDTIWEVLRFPAAAVLGTEVFFRSGPIGADIILAGFLVHMVAAVLFTLLIALILHRWGMLVGVIGGALIGAAVYVINFYGMTAAFDWLAGTRTWAVLAGHMLFGAVAGGLYEAMERDRFVPVAEPET